MPGFARPTDMTTLQPHQQRVVAERDELVDRLNRLAAFMQSPAFDGVDIAEQSRLQQQRHIMGQLAAVLNARIAAFATTPEPDFLAGVKACDLSGEGTCEACQ